MSQNIANTWRRLETAIGSNMMNRAKSSRNMRPFTARKTTSRTNISNSFTPRRSVSGTLDRISRPRTAQFSVFEDEQVLCSIPGLTQQQVLRIYKAKCQDLNIPVLQEQIRRFVTYLIKNLKDRIFRMKDSGIGPETGKVIGEILRTSQHFFKVELGKNILSDAGCVALARAIAKNPTLVHLDLSSNDLSPEGSQGLFAQLMGHPSLISLDVSSHEGLHRNRIGKRGAEMLGKMLGKNSILQFLNVGGTSLGNESLANLVSGLRENKTLVFLNLAGNAITHRTVEMLMRVMVSTRIMDLNLSSNRLGADGVEHVGNFIMGALDGPCHLQKLDLSRNDLNGRAVSKLFLSLRNNATVQTLILDHNPLGTSLNGVLTFLSDNVAMQNLNMNHCDLRSEGVILMQDGLIKNRGIAHLGLSYNQIDDEGAEALAAGLMKNGALKSLDLSGNRIRDLGATSLATSLRVNRKLERLILRDNNLRDESGQQFSEVTRMNDCLIYVNLDFNPINFKYIREVKNHTEQNRTNFHKNLTPQLKEHIETLRVREDALDLLKEQIQHKKREQKRAHVKLEEDTEKLEQFVKLEEDKFTEIKTRLQGIKAKSYKVSQKSDKLNEEAHMTQFKLDRVLSDIRDKVAVTAFDIKRLEKLRSTKREEFAIRRGQGEQQIQDLQQHLALEEQTRKLAESDLESLKKKVDEMKLEIQYIHDPASRPRVVEHKTYLASEKLASVKRLSKGYLEKGKRPRSGRSTSRRR